ncbi:hypothetical protein [Empedobacter brevis]|uniref:hypothetical protein n=1 Tax=Empedobacter brevis TaxID=247 RepID=UPI0039AF352F
MKNLYKKIISTFDKDEIIDRFVSKQITPVKYIDIYAEQYLDEENFELFSSTSLLVEWNIDHNQNPAIATVTFHVCYEQLRDTSNISYNRELGLNFLDFIDLVNDVLLEIETESTGKLKLINEGFNQMDSIIDVYLLQYECSYFGKIKNPQDNYLEGSYEKLNLEGNLVNKFGFD